MWVLTFPGNPDACRDLARVALIPWTDWTRMGNGMQTLQVAVNTFRLWATVTPSL